jgi:predicted metal-dependent peptidase
MIPVSDETLIEQVRSELLLDSEHPSAAFFATCAYHLTFVADRNVETMETNGTILKFNPDHARSLPPSRRLAVFAHEVAHVAGLDPYRRGSRDNHLWNVSCDHVVNLELKQAGYDVGDDWYCSDDYKGMSKEAVYAKLASAQQDEPPPNPQEPEPDPEPEEQPDDEPDGDDTPAPGDGEGDGDVDGDVDGEGEGAAPSIMPGCETGHFVDADTAPQQTDEDGNPGPPPMTAEDWAIVTEQAASASRAAGSMGAGIDRLIQSVREPQTDWREELKAWISDSVAVNTSWTRPNRRFVGADTYLPGPIKDQVGSIVIIVDTSGSVSQRMLDSIAAHVNIIASEVNPESIDVIYCDADIKGHEVFGPGDDVVLHAKGGGGTRFAPALAYIEEKEIEPIGGIFLTDLENYDRDPLKEPTWPMLWATPLWITAQPQFGDVLRVDIEQ